MVMNTLLIKFTCRTSLLTNWLVPTTLQLVLCAAWLTLCTYSVLAEPIAYEVKRQPSAVILMYHRFGENQFPSTNTTVDQLEDHISALQEGGHTVVPLDLVVAALQGKATLPDKAVAITVDDAYRSFLDIAWPRFKAAGFPVTLFVATEGVEQGYKDLLTWNEIRNLKADGVGIGAHSHGHGHYPALSTDAVTQDLNDMSAAFESALGDVPDLFAFPYGEAGLLDISTVKSAGFEAAFGQHSGAAGGKNDRHYLPRFALNENFGGPDRFRLVIDTLPLPVTQVFPPDPILKKNPPDIFFEVSSALSNLSDVSCFGPFGVNVEAVVEENQIQVLSDRPFPKGRVRVNCTLKSNAPETAGRWYWFGWQMISEFSTEGVDIHQRYR